MPYSLFICVLSVLLVTSPIIAQDDEGTKPGHYTFAIGGSITPNFVIDAREMPYERFAQQPNKTLARVGWGGLISVGYYRNQHITTYGYWDFREHTEEQLDYGLVGISQLGVGLRYTPPLKGTVQPYIAGQLSFTKLSYRMQHDTGPSTAIIRETAGYGKHNGLTGGLKFGIEVKFRERKSANDKTMYVYCVDIGLTLEHNHFSQLDYEIPNPLRFTIAVWWR